MTQTEAVHNVLNEAQKMMLRIEKMGLNRFQDSTGLLDIKVKRVDPAMFFDMKRTPSVIAGLMQSFIKTKPKLPGDEADKPDEPIKLDIGEGSELFPYLQNLLIKCAIAPKFFRETGEDGISSDDDDERLKKGEISINWVTPIMMMEHLLFQMGGAPTVTVATEEGETTLRSVATFPSSQ